MTHLATQSDASTANANANAGAGCRRRPSAPNGPRARVALLLIALVLLSLTSPARGQQHHPQALRYDVTFAQGSRGVYYKPYTPPTAFPDPPSAFAPLSLANIARKQQAASNPPLSHSVTTAQFALRLTCTESTPARCLAMLKTLQTAATLYSSMLALSPTRPIVLSATYKSFCANPPAQNGGGAGFVSTECPARLKSALGSAFPSTQWNLFGLEGVDPEFTYPQALAKQLSVVELPWADADISAQFNVDAPLWFDGDGEAIKGDQTDALYVVMHEILHGLGISTSWNAYASELLGAGSTQLPTTAFLTPHPVMHATSTPAAPKLAGFLPHAIYDRFLFDTVHQRPLAWYGFVMATPCANSTAGKGVSPQEFFTKVLQSRIGELVKDVHRAATRKDGVVFVYPDRRNASAPAGPTSGASGGGQGRAAGGNTANGGNSTAATPPRLVKRQSDADAPEQADFIALHTPDAFSPGSSLTHVFNTPSPGGANFLLRPTTEPGAMLWSLAASNAGSGGSSPDLPRNSTQADAFVRAKGAVNPVGPGVLRVLDTLGYTVQGGWGVDVGGWARRERRESGEAEWAEVAGEEREARCKGSWSAV